LTSFGVLRKLAGMTRPRQPAISWFERLQRLLDDFPIDKLPARPLFEKVRTVLQFLLLVWRGFVENRCPVRAAALSYTTLLAVVPLLAVVLSMSKNFLHDTSADLVPKWMNKTLVLVAPQLETVAPDAQRQTVEKIQSFIDNLNAGALGTLGTLFLIFVGVRLLMAIEQTFNDIWGIEEGRSIWRKIVYYWTTITLGPLLLLVAGYLTGHAEVLAVIGRLGVMPSLQKLSLQAAPYFVLWIAFGLMYALMPNTHVRPRAAVIGGVFAGTLWQINTWLSTLYVSRAVQYSKIYGTLGIIPILLVGLYFSWLIVLLGAQVAYASQNIRTYLQQRASERIDHRSRELIACRIVLIACEHFLRGTKPVTLDDLAVKTGAPAKWLNQLVHHLAGGGILAQVEGELDGIVPVRSPDALTVADVLEVVRTHPAGGDDRRLGSDRVVEKLLADLDATLRSAPANRTFSQLVER
jgi:membrane protein